MIDEIFGRNYQARRAELNEALASGVTRLAAAVRNAFTVLNRIQYSAPWSAAPRSGGWR